MVDPDHPLAALVRKAQADSPAPTPPSADGASGQPSQVEYTSDCEYLLPARPRQLQGPNQQGVRGDVEAGRQCRLVKVPEDPGPLGVHV